MYCVIPLPSGSTRMLTRVSPFLSGHSPRALYPLVAIHCHWIASCSVLVGLAVSVKHFVSFCLTHRVKPPHHEIPYRIRDWATETRQHDQSHQRLQCYMHRFPIPWLSPCGWTRFHEWSLYRYPCQSAYKNPDALLGSGSTPESYQLQTSSWN